MPDAKLAELLRAGYCGHLATISPDGSPYVCPLLYSCMSGSTVGSGCTSASDKRCSFWALQTEPPLHHRPLSQPLMASYEPRTQTPEPHMTTREMLEAEALKLAPADRSRLLERLLASPDADEEVESAWDAVADAREEALKSGAVTPVPLHEALARLEARFPG